MPVGMVGIGIQSDDYMKDSWNKLGVYDLSVSANGQEVFKMTMNELSFDQAFLVNELKDFHHYRGNRLVYLTFGNYQGQLLPVRNQNGGFISVEKAIYTEGPTFLNVMTPCPRGWGYPTDMLMQINKLAVDTCYWPLYEVIDGKYKINYKPAKKLPIEEFLKPQKRFKHMFKPGNEWMIEEFQKEVDKRWQELLDLEEITNK